MPLPPFRKHDGPLDQALAVAPGGRTATARSHVIKVWDPATAACVATIPARMNRVHALALRPDGKELAAAGADETARWELPGGKYLGPAVPPRSGAISAAVRPDGREVATGSTDGTIRLWDPDTGRLLKTLPAAGMTGGPLEYRPDGAAVAVADFRKDGQWSKSQVWVLDVATGKRTAMTGDDVLPFPPTFSGDGSRLAAVVPADPPARDNPNPRLTGRIRVWDVTTGKVLREVGPALHPALSPDGRRVAGMELLGTDAEPQIRVALWDVATGDRAAVGRTLASSFPLATIRFTPDGKRVIFAQPGEAVLWDPAAGTTARIASLQGGEFLPAFVRGVAVAPDGRTAVVGSDRGELIFADLANAGAQTATVRGRFHPAMAFRAGGRELVTAGPQEVVIWSWRGK